MFAHAEAVAAFGVHVELGGFVGGDPLLVELDAFGSEAELSSVAAARKWAGRRRGREYLSSPTRRRRSARRMPDGFRACSVKPTAAATVPPAEKPMMPTRSGQTPIRGMLAHVGHGRQSVGDRQRDDLADGLAEISSWS